MAQYGSRRSPGSDFVIDSAGEIAPDASYHIYVHLSEDESATTIACGDLAPITTL